MLDWFHEMGPEGDGRWPKEALIYYYTISYYTSIIVYTILLHYIILYYTTTLYHIILYYYNISYHNGPSPPGHGFQPKEPQGPPPPGHGFQPMDHIIHWPKEAILYYTIVSVSYTHLTLPTKA